MGEIVDLKEFKKSKENQAVTQKLDYLDTNTYTLTLNDIEMTMQIGEDVVTISPIDYKD